MEIRRPWTLDRVMQLLLTACGVVAVLFVLNMLKGVLLPFFVSCLIAYTLEPVVKWNKRWMKTRGRLLPVLATLVEFTLVMVGLGVILVPYIIAETQQMVGIIRQYASTNMTTPYLPAGLHEFIKENIDFNRIGELLTPEQWREIISKGVSSGWNFLSSGLSFVFGVLSWLIVFLYVVFIMLDYEKLMLSFKQLIPHNHRSRVVNVLSDVRNAMRNYFRGQFLIAMTVGLLFALGFYIIKLPMGVALGLFIGVLNMVPYLQLISLPVTALLCLVCSVDTGIDFWTIFWESMAVYVVVQCIQDLYLTPKIMGRAMGLNPAIILLSLSVWGCLLGFMGLIIALPLTTLLLSYYDRYVVEPYKKHELLHERHLRAAENENDSPPEASVEGERKI